MRRIILSLLVLCQLFPSISYGVLGPEVYEKENRENAPIGQFGSDVLHKPVARRSPPNSPQKARSLPGSPERPDGRQPLAPVSKTSPFKNVTAHRRSVSSGNGRATRVLSLISGNNRDAEVTHTDAPKLPEAPSFSIYHDNTDDNSAAGPAAKENEPDDFSETPKLLQRTSRFAPLRVAPVTDDAVCSTPSQERRDSPFGTCSTPLCRTPSHLGVNVVKKSDTPESVCVKGGHNSMLFRLPNGEVLDMQDLHKRMAKDTEAAAAYKAHGSGDVRSANAGTATATVVLEEIATERSFIVEFLPHLLFSPDTKDATSIVTSTAEEVDEEEVDASVPSTLPTEMTVGAPVENDCVLVPHAFTSSGAIGYPLVTTANVTDAVKFYNDLLAGNPSRADSERFFSEMGRYLDGFEEKRAEVERFYRDLKERTLSQILLTGIHKLKRDNQKLLALIKIVIASVEKKPKSITSATAYQQRMTAAIQKCGQELRGLHGERNALESDDPLSDIRFFLTRFELHLSTLLKKLLPNDDTARRAFLESDTYLGDELRSQEGVADTDSFAAIYHQMIDVRSDLEKYAKMTQSYTEYMGSWHFVFGHGETAQLLYFSRPDVLHAMQDYIRGTYSPERFRFRGTFFSETTEREMCKVCRSLRDCLQESEAQNNFVRLMERFFLENGYGEGFSAFVVSATATAPIAFAKYKMACVREYDNAIDVDAFNRTPTPQVHVNLSSEDLAVDGLKLRLRGLVETPRMTSDRLLLCDVMHPSTHREDLQKLIAAHEDTNRLTVRYSPEEVQRATTPVAVAPSLALLREQTLLSVKFDLEGSES